ncbi:MAG: hypothetical protein HFJ09_00505 [Lachnospiraceae bacterium]|nr:hypothetical protein [Lachnospiraceae bacterium]
MDFFELLFEDYKDDHMPDWSEAYMQLYSWQFQCFHEGIQTYYENTGKENTLKAVAYLQEMGFKELAYVMNILQTVLFINYCLLVLYKI